MLNSYTPSMSMFSRVTEQQVIGALKSAGSHDPDVLAAAKQTLVAPVKFLKLIGIWAYVTGGLATILIITAIFGIPLLFFGWWARKRASQNMETIESAFATYTRPAPGRPREVVA